MRYVYSTTALPPVDTLNDHSGFYFVTAVCIILLLMVWGSSSKIGKIIGTIVYPTIIGLAAAVSWSTGDVRHYENRPVEATLVGFQAEGFSEKSGKRYADVHYTYVVYKVPGEGNVMLRASPGQSYPDKAILYANKAAQQ